MRASRLLLLALAAAALAGCMRKPGPRPLATQPAPVLATPAPVATAAAAPTAAMAASSPGDAVEPAYTLDSGDKLRVVVFGQDGLSNSYSVDAAGNATVQRFQRLASTNMHMTVR